MLVKRARRQPCPTRFWMDACVSGGGRASIISLAMGHELEGRALCHPAARHPAPPRARQPSNIVWQGGAGSNRATPFARYRDHRITARRICAGRTDREGCPSRWPPSPTSRFQEAFLDQAKAAGQAGRRGLYQLPAGSAPEYAVEHLREEAGLKRRRPGFCPTILSGSETHAGGNSTSRPHWSGWAPKQRRAKGRGSDHIRRLSLPAPKTGALFCRRAGAYEADPPVRLARASGKTLSSRPRT